MNTSWRLWGAAVALSLTTLVRADTQLPEIVVTGSDGEPITCYTVGCQEILGFMMRPSQPLFDSEELEPEGPDREQFCKLLGEKIPQGCSSSEAPVVPGSQFGPWRGNGCGASSWSNWTFSAIEALGQTLIGNFSGNINAPFPGVSFEQPCNAHDGCYASISQRWQCDSAFNDSMRSACAASLLSEPLEMCNQFASAYHAAVGLGGEDAYNAGQTALQCAVWHREMDQNLCEK